MRCIAAGPLLRLRSDDQLVALFRMGYDQAFDAIDERYRKRLLVYTRRMLCGAGADPEDAVQDVFLRASRALRRDDRPVTLRAWLYRVATNRCLDELRRRDPAPTDVLEVSRSPLRDPVVESERREHVHSMLRDVARLPEQQRSALIMRELEGLSYAEISDVLGIGVPAVKSVLVRARVGLADAGEARDAPCAQIRADLALARDRGVRMSGRSRRHLRECTACATYRSGLTRGRRDLRGLVPGHGLVATLAKLLGLGGAASGAAAGGGAAAGAGVSVPVTDGSLLRLPA
jgi:RNA polymerase sigma factor (sigma-70 family)